MFKFVCSVVWCMYPHIYMYPFVCVRGCLPVHGVLNMLSQHKAAWFPNKILFSAGSNTKVMDGIVTPHGDQTDMNLRNVTKEARYHYALYMSQNTRMRSTCGWMLYCRHRIFHLVLPKYCFAWHSNILCLTVSRLLRFSLSNAGVKSWCTDENRVM